MNRPERLRNADDRLLAKLGGGYISRIQVASQGLGSMVGPIIGLYFIFSNANLTLRQSFGLIGILLVGILLTNILVPIYIRMITRQVRPRLDHIVKNLPLPENSDPIQAWKEILRLPGRAGIAQFITSYMMVMLPVVVFMRQVAGVSWPQVDVIFIGGSLTTMVLLIQSIIYIDTRLANARRALLPDDPAQQDVRLGIGQGVRQYFVIGILLLAVIFTIGTIGYGKLMAATVPGANPAILLEQLRTQLLITGAAVFGLGIFLASRLLMTISRPIQEMIQTVDEVRQGNTSRRATVITSDETAQLTIRLNQLLDQLQASRQELERSVDARTADLERKTSYFRAAAQIAHEATLSQDLNVLLKRTTELVTSLLGFYHTGIFLLDDSGTYAVLQAASSEGGQRMIMRGHRLQVGQQGIVSSATRQNRPYITMDVDIDRKFLKNPDLPQTRSEAAIPLTARGKVLGVLDIQSTEPYAFKQDDVEVLQIMADQIGLAVQNARSLIENQSALVRLETATGENIRSNWGERVAGARRFYRYTSTGVVPAAQPDTKPIPNQTEGDRLLIPITLRGQQIGEIALRRKKETTWNETERSLAIEVSNQVGLALENARLLDDAQRHAAQEQSLNELTAHLSQSLDSESILQTVVRELTRLPSVLEASVYIEPPDKPSSGQGS